MDRVLMLLLSGVSLCRCVDVLVSGGDVAYVLPVLGGLNKEEVSNG